MTQSRVTAINFKEPNTSGLSHFMSKQEHMWDTFFSGAL